ncbi:hypothetical protein H0H87_011440 [Tephrocybe sp. NHM501043]|nr:hypothetical protein H0H87_011440 [Tephrocybe sp. NHM501043]
MTADSSPIELTLSSSPFADVEQHDVHELEQPTLRSLTDEHTVEATITDDSAQERTAIASEDTHESRPGDKSLPHSHEDNLLSTTEEKDENFEGSAEKHFEVVADPLRAQDEGQELDISVEGGDISFSAVEKLYPALERKPSPVASKRASHLHLNLKPPSPQPWDLVDPPEADETKGNNDYYSTGSRKFRTLQSTIHTRPLIPKSSYYFGPPPSDSAFFTPPVGQIGIHHPREVIRIERDYTGGELVQFTPIYPLELEGRITPTQFLESINAINELLIAAHSLRHSFLDNTLAVLSFQLSRLFLMSHYDKEMRKLESLVDFLNVEVYNPVGLNILWPRNVAFLYLEIEYYVSSIFPFSIPHAQADSHPPQQLLTVSLERMDPVSWLNPEQHGVPHILLSIVFARSFALL